MKLYAKVTSERASKGQGGDYLDIEITDGDKKQLWHIQVIWGINALMTNNHVLMIDKDGKEIFRDSKATNEYTLTGAEKGNKQKGDKEIRCNNCMTIYIEHADNQIFNCAKCKSGAYLMEL